MSGSPASPSPNGPQASAEASRLISLRVPVPMLEELRRHAARRAMPYQSLLKHWLSERLEAESFRLERHLADLGGGGRAVPGRAGMADGRSAEEGLDPGVTSGGGAGVADRRADSS